MRASQTILGTLLALTLANVGGLMSLYSAEPSLSPLIVDEPTPLVPPPGAGQVSTASPVMIALDSSVVPATPIGMQTTAVNDDIERTLRRLGIPVLYRSRTAYNGIAVSATPAQIEDLRKLRGVSGIHAIPPKQRNNATAAVTTAVTTFWSKTHSQIGTDVRIGIIDSGIDYTHATFGGTGTPAAYLANDPRLVEAGSFPTAKVTGGYDFVGETYDAGGTTTAQTAAPDADPLDCASGTASGVSGGHGTHVAATAAGMGVDADGNPYSGPYRADVDFASFRVGPGFAPGAKLIALKIFGCRGTSVFLTPAIDYAIDPNGDGDTSDRLVDVLTIALGSPFGSASDPDAVAVERAIAAGVIVVVAAGESEQTFYSISSPATARSAIAVGASIDTNRGMTPVNGIAPFSARGPQRGGGLRPDIVAPGAAINSAAVGSGNGSLVMSGTSMATPQVAGAAALLRAQHPSWTPAQIKTSLMNAAVATSNAAGNEYPPSLAGAGLLNVANTLNNDLLVTNAEEPASVSLGYDAPWMATRYQRTRTLAITNTGEDLRAVRLSVKTVADEPGAAFAVPDRMYMVEPGQRITVPMTLTVEPTLLDFSPDSATALTSGPFPRHYLAEHSGIVEVTSTLGTRIRIGAALSAFAIICTIDGQPIDGRLVAASVSTVITIAPGPHTIVCTNANNGNVIASANVTLRDGADYLFAATREGSDYVILTIDTTPQVIDAENVLVQFVPTTPFVAAGLLDIYLDGQLLVQRVTPGQPTRFYSVPAGTRQVRFVPTGGSPDDGTYNLVCFSAAPGEVLTGVVGLYPGQDPLLVLARGFTQNRRTQRVPFQIFPRAAAATNAETRTVDVAPGATSVAVPLANTGARNLRSSVNGAQTPLTAAFELRDSGISPQIADLEPTLAAADLRYVAVASSFRSAGSVDNTLIFFGMAGYGNWSTPNEIQYRVVIDSTGAAGVPDGRADYVLVNTNRGVVAPPPGSTSGIANDVFITALYSVLPDGTLDVSRRRSVWNMVQPPQSGSNLDAAAFENSVMVQLIDARGLGLTATQPRFNYYVETRARDASAFNAQVDRLPAVGGEPWISYDVTETALTPINTSTVNPFLTGLPLFTATNDDTVTTLVDEPTLARRGTQQLLLLHYHNATALSRAEVVTLRATVPITIPVGPGLPVPRANGIAMVRAVIALPMVGR